MCKRSEDFLQGVIFRMSYLEAAGERLVLLNVVAAGLSWQRI